MALTSDMPETLFSHRDCSGTHQVKELVSELDSIEASFLEQGYTKDRNPSNSSSAGTVEVGDPCYRLPDGNVCLTATTALCRLPRVQVAVRVMPRPPYLLAPRQPRPRWCPSRNNLPLSWPPQLPPSVLLPEAARRERDPLRVEPPSPHLEQCPGRRERLHCAEESLGLVARIQQKCASSTAKSRSWSNS